MLTGSLVADGVVATAAERGDQPVPMPPHHSHDGFRNPGYGPHSVASLATTVPFFFRRALDSFRLPRRLAAPRTDNDGVRLRELAGTDAATVTWIGHSTLLVQMGGVTFLTDPIWSQYASPIAAGPMRLVEPGLAMADLPPIDFVVVSHNHYDHMDLPTLEALARLGARVFVPLANGETVRSSGVTDVVELDWWQSAAFGSASIHCVPARHWSRRGLFDTNEALWSGWLVEAGGKRFYFAGDTGMFDGFAEIRRRFEPIDLAALPIGAYLPTAMMAPAHLNPEEAIEAGIVLGARHSLAIHYGTFVLSDEPFDEPPLRYAREARRRGRDAGADWVLRIGETRSW